MSTNQTTISIRGNIIAEAKYFADNNNLFINSNNENKDLSSMLCFEEGSFFHLTGGWSAKSINIDELRPVTETELSEAINKLDNLKEIRISISGHLFDCFDDGLRINGTTDGQITPLMSLSNMLKAIKLNRECHDIEVDKNNNLTFVYGGENFVIPPEKLSPLNEKLYECSIPSLNTLELNMTSNKPTKGKNNIGNDNGNSLGM